MKTSELKEIIGEQVSNEIVCGRYGDRGRTAKGYFTGDPCYWDRFDDQWITRAILEAHPALWRECKQFYAWTAFEWQNATCFFRLCSDGIGPLGHSVDSGMVVAVPTSIMEAQLC